MKAVWNGVVIARSDDTVVVEGNHYFPANALDPQHFRTSGHHTFCSWKGTASYLDITVNGKINKNGAWFYPDPMEAAKEIKGRVAFWHGVDVLP
jgi:uncharacterized protein (DUF427 family)